MFHLRQLADVRLRSHDALRNLHIRGQDRPVLHDCCRPDNRSRADQDIFPDPARTA